MAWKPAVLRLKSEQVVRASNCYLVISCETESDNVDKSILRSNRSFELLKRAECLQGRMKISEIWVDRYMKGNVMGKKIEHLHWPDAPDLWMPYAPVIKVTGGSLVFLAGVTAAPVYHHHPHQPEEFNAMPLDMEGQARAVLENLKKSLEAVDADFGDVVSANRFVTDMEDQDSLNKVWAEYFGDNKPTTTTVQVVQLATDPRCLIEVNALAVVDS